MATPGQFIEQSMVNRFNDETYRREAHKQALSDEELQGKIQDEIGKRQAIIEKLPTLQGPERDKATSDLTEIAHNLRELYHPEKNPGAIEKLGHLLTDHLGIKVNDPTIGQKVSLSDARKGKEYDKQQKLAQQDQSTAQGWQAGAGLSPEQQAAAGGRAKFAEFSAKLKTMNDLWDQQNPNAKPEDKKSAYADNARTLWEQEFVTPQKGNNKPDIQQLTLSDGTQVSAQWVSDPSLPLKGKWQHLNGDDIEPSLLSGAKVTPKPAKLSGPQLLQDSYLATLKLPFGTSWDTLTPEQREGYQTYLNRLKQRSANRQATVTDRDGNVHVIDLSSSSGPVEVSAPSAAKPTQGGGTPKPKASGNTNSGGTSSGKGDRVLDFKKSTPAYTKLAGETSEDQRLANYADSWINIPKGQRSVEDYQLAIKLVHSNAGRVNLPEIDAVFGAGGVSNWLAKVEAKTISGELPDQTRNQLYKFIHGQLDADKKAVEQMDSNGEAPQTGAATKPTSSMSDDEFLMKVK
jgi:hypothetical protein